MGRAPLRAAGAAAGAAPLGGASESPVPKAGPRGARAAASSATGAGGDPHAAGDPPGPAPAATWAQGQQVCTQVALTLVNMAKPLSAGSDVLTTALTICLSGTLMAGLQLSSICGRVSQVRHTAEVAAEAAAAGVDRVEAGVALQCRLRPCRLICRQGCNLPGVLPLDVTSILDAVALHVMH